MFIYIYIFFKFLYLFSLATLVNDKGILKYSQTLTFCVLKFYVNELNLKIMNKIVLHRLFSKNLFLSFRRYFVTSTTIY